MAHTTSEVLISRLADWGVDTIFGIPGDGRYRLQPVHVRDHAGLLVHAGLDSTDQIVDSAGPEIFTFEQLVHLLRRLSRRARHPPREARRR